MLRRRPRLDLRHTESCTQAWEEMRGDSKSRHCDACEKMVYNFAGMTVTEIQRVLIEKEGRLCARIVRDTDGSVHTLNQHPRQPMGAGFVLAASLAVGPAAAAQTTEASNTARLSGTVLSPDGSSPLKGVVVTLLAGEKTAATGKTDEKGNFTLAVKPGKYDLIIARNVLVKSRIPSTELHAGLQTIPPLRIGFDRYTTYDTVTLGVVVSTYRYPVSFLFKHPIRYFRNIRHQLS